MVQITEAGFYMGVSALFLYTQQSNSHALTIVYYPQHLTPTQPGLCGAWPALQRFNEENFF